MLVVSAKVYAEHHGGRLPGREQGLAVLYPDYVDCRAALMCPARMNDRTPHYAINPSVAARKLADLGPADEVVLIYEVDALGVPAFPHGGRANYAFLDGNSETCAEPPDGFAPVGGAER